jgi:hypothetical protein
MTEDPNSLPLLFKRIINRVGRPLGVNPFPRAFPNPLGAAASGAAGVFDQVYETNYWGSAQSRSGVGSEMSFTEEYRRLLAATLRRHGFRRIFDAPCGDLNWMSKVVDESGIAYIGGDISARVVRSVQERFPALDVRVFDITKDTFPDTDLWHCRDCLFHLSFADIRRALENFATSSVEYALFTTHKARILHRNLDVPTGGFRFLDLEYGPIGLPPAECYIPDYRPGHDFPRYVGLWSRAAVTKALDRPWPSPA